MEVGNNFLKKQLETAENFSGEFPEIMISNASMIVKQHVRETMKKFRGL